MINNVNIRSCTHSIKPNFFFGCLLRFLDLFYFLFYLLCTYIHTCTNDLIRYPIQKNSKTCNHNYLGLGQGNED